MNDGGKCHAPEALYYRVPQRGNKLGAIDFTRAVRDEKPVADASRPGDYHVETKLTPAGGTGKN